MLWTKDGNVFEPFTIHQRHLTNQHPSRSALPLTLEENEVTMQWMILQSDVILIITRTCEQTYVCESSL
jgi:hypothetical protein